MATITTNRAHPHPKLSVTGFNGALALFSYVAIAIWNIAPARAASQITLTGTVTPNCTISVLPDLNAASLSLIAGTQHVTIGTVLQSCNKKSGYTIAVTSANCVSPSPTGAKLIGTSGGEKLVYSVESHNLNTGSSAATVIGLLASGCSGQSARVVTSAKINAETSTIFVNYTGISSLGADVYQDTLTFTMNVN